ncbi:hypothetical protein [Kordia jejudonensis]|uniref:hypothetical protein n=1 Tax=Kordia jejudonensis TaxID=1348245 RepID=UPI000629974A|nr:hypothetical protein [Kordia jejudonensis]
MKKWSFYSVLIILFSSCTLSHEELKVGWWKYGGGYYIGDSIDFKLFHLKNDTIYFNEMPKALLKSSTKGYKAYEDYIIIKSLDSDETGKYHHK